MNSLLFPRRFSLWAAGGVLGLSLLKIVPAHAQDITFQHLTTDDGLSSNNIQSIVQDQRGCMWIGTRGGGLNRYDGYEVIAYKRDPSNPTNSLSNNTDRASSGLE